MKGQTVSLRTMSNFLRNFTDNNIKNMEKFLALQTQVYNKFLKKLYPDEWRRERDSNPRDAINAYTLSKRTPSATQPPLHFRFF